MDAEHEYRDRIAAGRARGRGSQLNPGNRFEAVRLSVLGEHLDAEVVEAPAGRQVPTRVLADATRSILSRVDSPDLPFSWSLNPYRGCEHGCVYCYARPYHEFLGLSCGLDFETVIIAKPEAPALLDEAISKPGWRGDPIVLSGVTDPYQPVEAKLRVTRGCLEVCSRRRQPVSVITKNRLITRDLDVLRDLHAGGLVSTIISLTTLDARLAASMEPRASAPRDRLAAIRDLAGAGVPVMVMTAPIIPGVNDREIPALLTAAKEAGAIGAGYTLLRLPHQVKAIFLDWLRRELPDRAAHVEALVRSGRGGELHDGRFGVRMRGSGPFADQIAQTHRVFARRLGLTGRVRLASRPPEPAAAGDRRAGRSPPRDPAQGLLFGGDAAVSGRAYWADEQAPHRP